jgi:ribosomal subunit interface protein
VQVKINEEASVEVVVKGRHCEVSDRFRAQVEEKLTRLEKYHHRIIRVDVEISKESNPRLSDQSTRVEITMRSKGPVIRAEAAADEKLTALRWRKLLPVTRPWSKALTATTMTLPSTRWGR